MKFFTYYLFFAFITIVTVSCSKQDVLHNETPKVVNIQVTGSTAKRIEFVYRDSVVAVGEANGSNFDKTVLLPLNGSREEIKIIDAESRSVITSRPVTETPFNQKLTIYYDGSKAYDHSVNYLVKGYAMTGELEFLLDGNVVGKGTSVINNTFVFFLDNNQTRELQVRKTGTTIPLITKQVSTSPANGQSLKFFYDGTKMVDNVQVNPPSNPANMAVSAQFTSVIAPSVGAFLGGNIDLVFYQLNRANNTVTKVTPEVRVTLPSDGSFASFELPPLPAGNYAYRFDICTPGTNASPYNTTAAAIKPIRLNEGKSSVSGTTITFETGKSKLFLIKDSRQLSASPAPVSNVFVGLVTDLSEYFQ